MDETGCSFRALPDKTFSERSKRCKVGKSSKQRVAVAFFVNAAGGRGVRIRSSGYPEKESTTLP